MNRSDEWSAAQAGKAKDAFNRATTKAVEPAKATEQGQGSAMIKQSRPTPVPQPPAIGHVVDRQIYRQRIEKEHQAAKERNAQVSRNPARPVIDLKHQQEGSRLHQRFQKAARKEQDRGR